MARRRRKRSARVIYVIPGVATEAYPITQTPVVPLIFGTMTRPRPTDVSPWVLGLPQSVIENVIDHLHDRPVDLQACCLVSKNWKARSQSHLFRRVRWTTKTVSGWCQHVSPHSEGPAGFATVLVVVSLLEHDRLGPIKDHFTSFRNVTSLTLRDLNFDDPLFDPGQVPVYFNHLKLGLKSLTLINANGSCGKLLSFASFFPHVENFTISHPGDLIPPDPAISLEYRPLRGTLFLRGHSNRHADFIKLLSRVPPVQCHTVRLEHWGEMHVQDFDGLLKCCSKSLEILDVSVCKDADEPFSTIRPNFSLCPRLTEFRIELQRIDHNPPSIINTLLTSAIVLSRITFVIYRKVEPEDLISYVKAWRETDITVARFATKLFCRDGGRRLLLTFKVVKVLDFTQLVPYSIERGVKVVIERGDDEEFTLPACVSCKIEHPDPL